MKYIGNKGSSKLAGKQNTLEITFADLRLKFEKVFDLTQNTGLGLQLQH